MSIAGLYYEDMFRKDKQEEFMTYIIANGKI